MSAVAVGAEFEKTIGIITHILPMTAVIITSTAQEWPLAGTDTVYLMQSRPGSCASCIEDIGDHDKSDAIQGIQPFALPILPSKRIRRLNESIPLF